VSVGNKLASAYVKCMRLFFGFPKYSSVSAMLIQLNLPSFNAVLHNATAVFHDRLNMSGGAVMNAIRLVGCSNYGDRFRVIHCVFSLGVCVCPCFTM